MKVFSMLLVAVSLLLGVSCERHEFEGKNGTRQLHEHHGAGHAAGDGHAHGDGDGHAHGADDKHAEEAHGKEAHGSKEESHGEKAGH